MIGKGADRVCPVCAFSYFSASLMINTQKRKASRLWLKTALIASWFDVLSVSLRSQGRKDTIYLVG